MSNPTVSTLDAHTGFWLRLVSNQVSSRFQSLLDTEEGCSVTEWVALRVLLGHPGTTHAELIQALAMTKGATSKVVTRLEQRGLARREFAEGRSREQLIVLTPAGEALVPRLALLADANDAHFFGHLDRTESDTLQGTLKSLVSYHELQGPPLQ